MDTADHLFEARRFVASGCLDGLLAGCWFWLSLAILASGAVLWKGGEAVEAAPRKAADEAAQASKIGPRRLQNRANDLLKA